MNENHSADASSALLDAEPEAVCGEPCDPAQACDNCAEYWQRMEQEGYWDRNRHRWTDKGWHQITK